MKQILHRIAGAVSVLMLMFAFATELSAQESVQVSGTVSDETGSPLPGAAVIVKGTTDGTMTDIDGKFSFRIPAGKNVVLEFSCLGMETVEMPVGKQTVFNVTLETAAIGLDEAVAIGYGTMIRRDISSAVSSVESEALNERATSL